MSSLATCSDVIRLWDTGGGGGGGLELKKTTNVAAAATNSCCWNHNGQVVATAGDNGSITVLKLSGSIVPAGVLSAHEKAIRGITFSSKSRKLAAGGDAGVVEVWDLKRNNSRVTMRGHRGPVTCVSFFDRDSCVAAGDERGKVILHRVADAPSDDEASATLPPAGGYSSVTGLSMASAAAGPAMLGVSYADGTVRLWDTGSRACVREMQTQHRGAAAGIVFHPQNPNLVATAGHDGVVRCTDVRVGERKDGGGGDGVLKSIQTDAPLTCVSFHHEGLALAAGASDGTVRLVDLRTAREAINSARPTRVSNGGGGGVDGGGRGYFGEGSGGGGGERRRPLTTTPAVATEVAGVGNPAGKAAAAVAEATPYFSVGSHGGPIQQQQHHHHQPAAENTSSSKGNGDSAPGAGANAVGAGAPAALASSSRQRHQDPYGVPNEAPAGVGGGGAPRYGNQSVATPPQEKKEARWGGDDDHRGSSNGAPAPRAQDYVDSAAAVAAAVVPAGRPWPNSSSPERVAAGFDRRRRENGGSLGVAGGGMTTGEGDEWDVQPPTTAYGNKSGGEYDRATVLSTPDSRGARVDAGGGGGSGRGTRMNGDSRAGSGVFSSPSGAPRKPAMHSGGPSTAGGVGRTGAAVVAGDGEAIVRREPRGEEEGAAPTAGGGQVVSLDRSVLEQVLSNHVSGLREELRQELRNLHVDMLRQFHSLQDEQSTALSGFEERLGGLVAENQALRAENDRLRRVY
ncbi:neural precursor cell expressed, developmentally down-regulated 1 [Ectocarpus siliculosus]|uniref:Neural cell expressed, developmentally down-regulated 1 n=1 Tax=Ectocarpus siliculosus TaxID=2880 RepID=D8LSS5_ECTSI|nr:neural precursor cell expressed, developmentally down-regulated 1 [Ectocarpus siliculosus]|eukprot:CBN75275.1 neural precursor cell expressed, developmentally down-regulated 1 [Ectocarpus siliculosus]